MIDIFYKLDKFLYKRFVIKEFFINNKIENIINSKKLKMIFPNEIYEIILEYITDVESISNCRKTCFLFNEILKKSCIKISENKKRDFNNPFPRLSNYNNLVLNFLYSFENIKYLDFPIFANHSICRKISSLNLQRLTLRVTDVVNIMCCLDIFMSENKTVKIFLGKRIYWIKKGFFGKCDGDYNFVDYLLMEIANAESVISNKYLNSLHDVDEFIYLSNPEKITSLDYYPALCLKSYKWRPILSDDRRKLNYLYEINKFIKDIEEVRPKILEYEMPVYPEYIQDMKNIYINVENYSYIEDDKLCFSYNNKSIDLNNLKEAEEYIDDYFEML